MSNWNKDFEGISIKCSDKLLQIKNDGALRRFLDDPQTNGSVLIADYAVALYKKEMNKELKISRDSLAIEILGHVYVDKFADAASKVKALEAAMKSIRNRTDVIDCGEGDIDSNRKIWDDLEKRHLKGIIFAMCGKGA